jgi:hypothetical protein
MAGNDQVLSYACTAEGVKKRTHKKEQKRTKKRTKKVKKNKKKMEQYSWPGLAWLETTKCSALQLRGQKKNKKQNKKKIQHYFWPGLIMEPVPPKPTAGRVRISMHWQGKKETRVKGCQAFHPFSQVSSVRR